MKSTRTGTVHLEARRMAREVRESLSSVLSGFQPQNEHLRIVKTETFSRSPDRERELSVEAMSDLLCDALLGGKPQHLVEEPLVRWLKALRQLRVAQDPFPVSLDDAILEGEKAEGEMEVAEQVCHKNPNPASLRSLQRAHRRRTLTGENTVRAARQIVYPNGGAA